MPATEWSAADCLLACLRGEARVDHLSESQWNSLLDLAERHSVLSPLHSKMPELPNVPDSVRKRLRAAYVTAAMRGLQLYVQIEKFLHTLNEAGIPVILLKGSCLAQECYGNVALRPMTDIDLLARREDLQRVVDCFKSLGYAPEHEGSIDDQCAVAAHLAAMVRPASYPIEIHWHVEGPDSPFNVDLDGLWQRKRPMTVGKEKTFQLSLEDTLLHLCLHAARHAWRDWADEFALKSICDLAAVCQKEGALDWKIFKRRVIESRSRRVVFLMLTLAHDWLAAKIPAKVLADLRPADFDDHFIRAAKGQMLAEEVQPIAMGTQAARLLGREPLHRRITAAARRLFPSAAELQRQYAISPGSPWTPFFYLVRWRDLLKRDLPALAHALRGDGAARTQINQASRGRTLREWMITTAD
jgi:hypothetical protein